MPKLYRTSDDQSEFNSLSSIIATFNFFAMIFIASAYIAIYLKSTSAGPDQSSLSKTAKARKITILILTDMCCWLPICVMSFLSIAGTALPSVFTPSQPSYFYQSTVH